VAAGPAPGRLFPQLFQKSSIMTVCQIAPAAGALWQADGSDIPPYCSAYRLAAAAKDASGGILAEFGNAPGCRHEKAVRAAFAIIRGWFARRVRSALWSRGGQIRRGRPAHGPGPARSARYPARRGKGSAAAVRLTCVAQSPPARGFGRPPGGCGRPRLPACLLGVAAL